MTKEIPQELAQRMAKLLSGANSEVQASDKYWREREAILAALLKDDPLEDAVAGLSRFFAEYGVSALAREWAIIKGALAERPAKSEAEIRADERAKAENEIANLFQRPRDDMRAAPISSAYNGREGFSGVKKHIRSGAYRKTKP